uniref:Endo/exonuclease/phosphatase domain-containing protein n=1 Tax=Rhabditophanes sp. KR3021 TaxID=114890 RepID=A0AC35TI68_9BILA
MKKWTWQSSNRQQTKAEIDYILADSETAKKDLEVINFDKFNIGSDHRLMLLTLFNSKSSSKKHAAARALYSVSRPPDPQHLWDLAMKEDWTAKIKEISDIEEDF